jgi:hypothetical protein
MRSLKRSWWLVLILVLAAMPSSAERLKHGQKDNPAQNEQQPKSDQRGTEKSPLIVKLLNTSKNAQQAAADTEEIKRHDQVERWTLRIYGLLAAIALFQLVAFIWQAISLKRTIAVTREIGERQLRAYITVSPGSIIEQDEEKGRRHFELHPVLRNTGQTPAYDVQYTARVEIQSYPLPEDFAYPVPAIGNYASVSCLGAQNVSFGVIGAEATYGAVELAAVRAAAAVSGAAIRRLWLWGTVRYTDAFKEKRYTNFCFYVLWGDEGVPVWMHYARHNDAN